MGKPLNINITPEWAQRAAEREPESGIVSAGGHVGRDVVYELPYPSREYAVGTPQWAADVTDRVVRRVAELPDRTSPDNWPEAMLVTADELREIISEEAAKPAALPHRATCHNCGGSTANHGDQAAGIILCDACRRDPRGRSDGYVVARPACPKCGVAMNFVDGGAPEHDVKVPHWRCEVWVGRGVCGATRPEGSVTR